MKKQLFNSKILATGLLIALLITITTSSVNASIISDKAYKYKNTNISETFSKDITKNSYKKIVTSYSQLKKLKKYVKGNYNKPKKYLRILNKYNKRYFKKNALVFATGNVDMNSKEYIFSSLEKKSNKIIVNIGINYTLKEGMYTTTEIRYSANTYFINIKKSKLKNIKKVKFKYSYINEENDSQLTTKM